MLRTEGRVRSLGQNFYPGYTFETFRPVDLVAGGEESQDQAKGEQGPQE